MGCQIPLDRATLAARVARDYLVLRLPACGTQNHAIESLNRVIRKTNETRGSFPTHDDTTNLIYLAIGSFESAGRCVRERGAARNQFAILYPEWFNK